MPRAIHRLSARAAETISKLGRHADGGGLYLSISNGGRRRWVFLYTWRGKIREAGLGTAGKGGVSLKDAREKAAQGRRWVMQRRGFSREFKLEAVKLVREWGFGSAGRP